MNQDRSQREGNRRNPCVFLSYAHADGAEFLRTVKEKLEEGGLAERRILVDDLMNIGDNWKGKVTSYLDRSRVAILLFTKSVPASEAIAFELAEIRKRVDRGDLVFLWLPADTTEPRLLGLGDYISPSRDLAPLTTENARANYAEELAGMVRRILTGKQVLVAGSKPEDCPDLRSFETDCEELGAGIIKGGYSFVCGSARLKTADAHALRGAAGAASAAELAKTERVITCVGTRKGFKEGGVEVQTGGRSDLVYKATIEANSEESRPRQLESSDVVVLVGGGSGSGDIACEACWQNKLVIPTGAYGGTGRLLFKALSRRLKRTIKEIAPEGQQTSLLSSVDALSTRFDLDHILKLIEFACTWGRPLRAAQFAPNDASERNDAS